MQDPAAAEALLLRQAMKAHLSHARKVLAGAAVPEPSKAGTAQNLTSPVLTVQVMQRNVSHAIAAAAGGVSPEALPRLVIAPAAYGYTPVSKLFECNLKDGNAVKCNIAITSSSLTDAYKPNVDNFLVFTLNTPGQVRHAHPCRGSLEPSSTAAPLGSSAAATSGWANCQPDAKHTHSYSITPWISCGNIK
jgi:hypothetical protein